MFPFLPEGLIQGRQHRLVDGDLVLGDHWKQVGSHTHKWRCLPAGELRTQNDLPSGYVKIAIENDHL